MSTKRYKVTLHLYDLSQGMAKALSPSLLGKQIDGIWHTGLVVYGYEYFYGGGIQYDLPARTPAGQPTQVIELGATEIGQQAFHDYLHSIAGEFTPEKYSLLRHNCNNFCDVVARFLTGKGIPSFITGLPEEALNTPLGAMFRPFIEQMEQQMKAGAAQHMVPWGNAALDLPRGVHEHAAVATDEEERKTAQLKQQQQQQPAKQSKMVLSSDKKHKSFHALIKAASRKLRRSADADHAELALSTDEEAVLASVVKALSSGNSNNNNNGDADAAVRASLPLFDRLMQQWPIEHLFAVVGLFRLVVLRRVAAMHVVEPENAALARIVSLFKSPPQDDGGTKVPKMAAVLALCTLANLFQFSDAAVRMAAHEDVVDAVAGALTWDIDEVRMTAATVVFNMSLAVSDASADDAHGERALESCVHAASMVANALVSNTAVGANAQVCERLLAALTRFVRANEETAMILDALEFDAAPIAAKHAKLKPLVDAFAEVMNKARQAMNEESEEEEEEEEEDGNEVDVVD